VYRAAWVIAFVLAIVALFTLGRPDTPKLSQEPATFDGLRAAADLRELAQGFPQRVAGSDADNRAALWVTQQFKRAGLEPHIDGVAATAGGRSVALQNVWAVSEGQTAGTIMVIANRDVPPLATQGANDNASGVAAMLELARTFTVTAHQHSIVYVCTSGDAFGALGAGRFAETHRIDDLYAVIALHKVATPGDEGIGLDGWSATARTAPPWLWLLSAPAARVTVNTEALLPRISTQVLRLAVPASSGSQAPFVAAGVPGISLSWAGPRIPPPADTVEAVSTENLTRVGTTASAMILAIDATAGPGERSGGAIFLTRQRTLPGGTLAFILAVLLLPLAAVTLDLYAHGRRARISLGPAWKRAALHLAPWLVVILIVYFANLVGLLPKSPGAVIPPDSHVVAAPRYLRVAVLVVLLVLAYVYAAAVERRLERHVPTDQRATIFVAHACLVIIAVPVLLVNPYSLLLVLPAAVLWPLARPGAWTRSILPVYAGLGMIVVALVYFASQLGLGWKVWWYFFLLLESRTIPVGVVLLGAVFLSTAGMLAHTLHGRETDRLTAATDGAAVTSGDIGEAIRSPGDAPAGGDRPPARAVRADATLSVDPDGDADRRRRERRERREARRRQPWPRRAGERERPPEGPDSPNGA
jgi:Peptidase family M28